MTGRPPVIIIGMHRAGTSMLTRSMQGFGFFMGRGTTRNEECRWTNHLNYWLFRQSSATWERPLGVDALLADADSRELVVDYLDGVTRGPASVGYLGLRRWLRHRSMHALCEPWGWKDPRNTFTLPLWLELFPQARVLHIMRHGVDVAQSLLVRREQALARAAARYRRRRRRYVNNPLAPKRSGFAHSPRVRHLHGGLALWREYTGRARQHVASLGSRALELRYETLLEEPLPHLQEVLDFCGLPVATADVEREAARFRADRAYAYRNDGMLNRFAGSVGAILAEFGYQ